MVAVICDGSKVWLGRNLTELAVQAWRDVRRTDRAVRIPSCDIKQTGPQQYQVKSQSNGGTYTVDLAKGSCTCPDYEFRQRECKHPKAARLESQQCEYDPETCQGCMLFGNRKADHERRHAK